VNRRRKRRRRRQDVDLDGIGRERVSCGYRVVYFSSMRACFVQIDERTGNSTVLECKSGGGECTLSIIAISRYRLLFIHLSPSLT
jgi:hypothetical protein